MQINPLNLKQKIPPMRFSIPSFKRIELAKSKRNKQNRYVVTHFQKKPNQLNKFIKDIIQMVKRKTRKKTCKKQLNWNNLMLSNESYNFSRYTLMLLLFLLYLNESQFTGTNDLIYGMDQNTTWFTLTMSIR